MNDTDVRVFSAAMATRALPLVRRIVADLLADYPRWQDLVAQYELLAAGARAEMGESVEQLRVGRAVQALAERIGGYHQELEQIGCQLKDPRTGLVDFFALHEGRLVCLCWQHDEPAVTHWHELEAGFAGRQALPENFDGEVA